MKTSPHELSEFCNRWLAKAQRYDINYLPDCFDKFTTLYTVFNTVYSQAGFLIRQRDTGSLFSMITQKHPRVKPFATLPDRLSATSYVVQYYGERRLQQEIKENQECKDAVSTLVNLIETGRFYFHDDPNTGHPDRTRDLNLAQASKTYDPKAILSIIYQARCNMFHGEKAFVESQRQVLPCLITLLEFITLKVLHKLLTDLENNQANP